MGRKAGVKALRGGRREVAGFQNRDKIANALAGLTNQGCALRRGAGSDSLIGGLAELLQSFKAAETGQVATYRISRERALERLATAIPATVDQLPRRQDTHGIGSSHRAAANSMKGQKRRLTWQLFAVKVRC